MYRQAIIIKLLTIINLLIISFCSECALNNGALPSSGSCAGPMERAQLRVLLTNNTNYPCGLNKIKYYPDSDTSLPAQCGKCTPGTSFTDNYRTFQCSIDEYCNDYGECIPLTQSPFYLKECPYQTSGLTVDGTCGPGLKCIRHGCIQCLNGEVHSSSAVCVNNKWTFSNWDKLLTEPLYILLVFISSILLINIILLIALNKKEVFPIHSKID
eukprot:TRINITY_DN2349_c0_g1_i2.p1 TRINITY_DN2349_c0_g1~~TRINITY_DN2349_c0_g1_i2.p1  ORF type:complete len:213 (+),score=27.08 TRINITY_DN2349_c0_g1_i2:60-698(+)